MSNSFQSRAFEVVPNHLIGRLTKIYEFKGKEKLYKEKLYYVQAPEVLAADTATFSGGSMHRIPTSRSRRM